MGRPSKSIATKTGGMTKEEIEMRLKQEEIMRGQSDLLVPPEYLNDVQTVIFNEIKESLKESNILGNIDIFVLTQTAITIERIQSAETDINERGQMISGKANPSIKIRESYTKDFFRLCNELCLSPQARAKMANTNFKAEVNKVDPLLQVLGM